MTYLPTLPGDYSILVKYNDKHIPGSPFTAKITGRVAWLSGDLLLGDKAALIAPLPSDPRQQGRHLSQIRSHSDSLGTNQRSKVSIG